MEPQHTNPLTPLAERFLVHLSHEENFLQQMRAGLLELNEALRKGGVSQIDAARIKQVQLIPLAETLAVDRSSLCNDLSLALNLPIPQISITRISAALSSPWPEQLLALRDRLKPLIAEIHFLNTRNTALINFCRTYIQRLFAGARGSGSPVTRYGPTGSQLDATYGTLFVVMG